MTTMTMTYTEALARHGVTPADLALAEIEVPVLCGPQRQGDVLILPRPAVGAAELTTFTLVGADGVRVVAGEATGNAHILDAVQGDVFWLRGRPTATDLTLGVVHVAAGGVAHLVHTDEHGCNGVGPGTYRLTGKREMADEIRRVAD